MPQRGCTLHQRSVIPSQILKIAVLFFAQINIRVFVWLLGYEMGRKADKKVGPTSWTWDFEQGEQ
jgi:hypothetical protein